MDEQKTPKWKILRHNGVAFPRDYEPRGLTVKIKTQPVKLEPLQEEMLMAWAKKIGTPYVDDTVFQDNFLASLRERWAGLFDGVTIADIDFSELQRIADSEKLANLPEDERKRVSAERKKLRDELKEKYGHAQVDDHIVEIGAYLVEPPGIFMGRGEHPMRGKWKPRIYSYDVTLNLDEEASIPPAAHIPPGENAPRWDRPAHDHSSLWVARWQDPLADRTKYVWLAETSHLRQEREKEKYEKAQNLAASLEAVRAAIREGMRDKDEKKRKVATVTYLIDRLAMRVGDEKDEDEADTVGASTLRVEHVKVHEDDIKFDFLGKDSVRWEKTLPISGEDKVLARNLREFMTGKKPGDQIFPEITSSRVNDFLKSVMPGLSAKVFRTFHATTTVDEYLKKRGRFRNGASPYAKENAARMANLEAAIMCNHKRTPPKNWRESLNKRKEALAKLRTHKPDLPKLDAQVKTRQQAVAKLNADLKKFQATAPALLKKKQAALAALESKPAPTAKKALAQHNRHLRAARKSLREATKLNRTKTRRFKERIAAARQSLDRAKDTRARAAINYHERIEKAELQYELARRTRDYNLNTSLKNYIDPRTYRRWGEQVDYDWTRLYTTGLKRKFQWAIADNPTDSYSNGDGE